MKKYLFFFIIITSSKIIVAQNAYIDSLKTWITNHPTAEFDSLRITNYHQLSYRLAEVDPILAWKYAYDVDKLALKAKIKTGHAMSKINFALLEKLDGNYEQSQEYYLTAMQIAEKMGWTHGVAVCLNNIGEGYKELHQYDKCIEYTTKAIELNKISEQSKGIANNYEVIGDAFFLSGKYGLALNYFRKGLELTKNSNENHLIKGKLLTDMGKVYNSLKKYKIANNFFEVAAKINIQNNEKLQTIATYIEHSKSYRNQGELPKSINLLKKGLVLVNELQYNKAKSELFAELSTSYHLSGYLEAALDNFQKHKAIDDQISKKKIATRNEVLKLRLDSYFKEKENVQLKQIKFQQETEIKSKASWIGLLVGLMVLGILFAYYWFTKNKINNLNKVQAAQAETIRQMEISEQIRKQIARDLHDDMGSTLSSISILSQVAEKEANSADSQTKNLLGKINRNSQRMLDTMNDIVWTTQPVNDTIESISVKIREFAAEMLDAKDIKYNINIDENLVNYKLPPNQVYNFYLIIKEAINNIAKYAMAENVEVNISKSGSLLKLIIADDGIGFEKQKTKETGNGLKNMDRRSHDLGGQLEIVSQTNVGTTLTLQFPIKLS